MEENLWKISPNTSKAPNIILEAHAKFLTESTNGLVIGYIKTEQPGFVSSSVLSKVSPITNNPNVLESIFQVEVPSLNYKLEIMKITFSVFEYYPLILNDFINNQNHDIKNEEDFRNILTSIIPSENMTKVINNLFSQAQIRTQIKTDESAVVAACAEV